MVEEKKKVLFLIHTLGGGGAEKALVNLVNNLNPKKYSITVMTVVDVGELRHSLNENIIYKTTIKLRHKSQSTQIKKDESGSLLGKKSFLKSLLIKVYVFLWRHMPVKLFHKIFIGNGYDVEVAFLEGICTKVIASSNNKHSNKIAWVHVDLIHQKKSDAIFKSLDNEKQYYEKFDRVICVSKAVEKQFLKKFGTIDSVIETKHNLINESEILAKSREQNALIERTPGVKVLVSVGRLNNQKGYDRLLKVIKRLKNDGIRLVLYIIGEGTMKKELEDYIKKSNLQDNVVLLGFRTNPYVYLVQGDVFVCSSRAEGFSTAVSEAVILGLPVVSVDVAGAKEILGVNNEFGIVTYNSENGLYDGLKSILCDDDLYMHYSKMVKKRKGFFSIKQNVKEIEGVLDG